ncbi:MAG TPA: DUF2334 domain-containing protein [Thermoguttaceae bacterium]
MSVEILMRFDDICPTLNWKVWDQIEKALIEHGIRPILAVVPDNCDPSLMVEPPAADFWQRLRQYQAQGWIMAMHGYQHRYVTNNAGLVGRRKKSEFAGLPVEQQEEKLRLGMKILNGEGIHPTVWVAPGHTFDAATVSLLGKYGIRTISDGFFRYPYRARDGMFWVPQQLWELQRVPDGVWTVCYHLNGWGVADLETFRRDLDHYRDQIVSLPDVIGKYDNRRRRWWERIYFRMPWAYYLIRAQLELHS